MIIKDNKRTFQFVEKIQGRRGLFCTQWETEAISCKTVRHKFISNIKFGSDYIL